MVLKASLACGLQECIGNLWKNEESGDFTVVVEGSPFLCHRLILSACSSFFQALFRSEMKETQENRTIINGMTKDTLEVILTSVYMGTDGLTTDNILNIWPATVQLQIKYLIKECEDFVMQNISVDNCFSILYYAHLLSCQQVVDYSLDFIAKHFEDICNTEGLLQLSFDDFYRIVTSNMLTASSEDVVVKTVLKWVEYTDNQFYKDEVSASSLDNHNMEICDVNNQQTESLIKEEETVVEDTSVIKNNNGNEISEIMCENSVKSSGADKDHDGDLNRSENMEENKSVMSVSDIRYKKIYSEKMDTTERNNRKQHLYTLISSCRVHMLDFSFHQQLLTNYKLVSFCEKTFNLILNSLFHNPSLGSQHVHRSNTYVSRASAAWKHVMVFGVRENVMAYNLDNGSIDKFVKFPADFVSVQSYNITVCDNMLYVLYKSNAENCILSMYSVEQQWKCLNYLKKDSPSYSVGSVSKVAFGLGVTVLPFEQKQKQNSDFGGLFTHDTRIYRYSFPTDSKCFFEYCHHMPDNTTEWITCSELKRSNIFCTGFRHYILCFYKLNSDIYLDYYDTQTKKLTTTVKYLSQSDTNIISFTHQEDVFIVQSSGSLWKVTSSDTQPVDFQLISKLWNFPVHLYGGVIYREQLFVFYRQTGNRAYMYQVSLPGIFESFKMVQIDSETNCWPMILPDVSVVTSFLTSYDI